MYYQMCAYFSCDYSLSDIIPTTIPFSTVNLLDSVTLLSDGHY